MIVKSEKLQKKQAQNTYTTVTKNSSEKLIEFIRDFPNALGQKIVEPHYKDIECVTFFIFGLEYNLNELLKYIGTPLLYI